MKPLSASLILTLLLIFNIDLRLDSKESDSLQLNGIIDKKVPHFSGYLLNDSIVDETILTNKIVLLNFMFIGCNGCMLELPLLARLNEKYANSNFMIVTIMCNGIEDIKSYQGIGDTSKIFYQARKMYKYESIKNLIIAECKAVNRVGPKNVIITCPRNISDKFFVDLYPSNLLIDKSGIIIKRYKNLFDDTEYANLQLQIDSLLKLN